MSRSVIGPRKLKNRIQPLMPDGWTAVKAMVRGGWTHGAALVFGLSPEGEKIVGQVNYLTGERWEAKDGIMRHWTEA